MKNRNIRTIRNILAALAIAAAASNAQAQDLPNSFNYQAVVNDENGAPVAQKDITVEISIMQGDNCVDNPGGCTMLWQELHTPKTNDFGLFNVEIGDPKAINTTGGTLSSYSDINWLDISGGCYFMKVRADFGESEVLNGMSDLGTTKFSAVPYSLVALSTDLAERAKKLDVDDNGKVDLKISQLADVSMATQDARQHLVFDGTKWKAEVITAAESGVKNLNDFDNVSLDASLKAKHVMVFDGNNFVNKMLSLDDLNDVHTTSSGTSLTDAQAGYVLTFTGTAWTAQKPTAKDPDPVKFEDLVEVSEATKAKTIKDKDVVYYDNGKWKVGPQTAGGTSLWSESTDKTTMYDTKHKVCIGVDAPGTVVGSNGKNKVLLTIGSNADNLTTFDGKSLSVGGDGHQATASGSISLGSGLAKGGSSIAGSSATTNHPNSIVFGLLAESSGEGSIVIGDYNNEHLNGSKFSAVFGTGNAAVGEGSLVCGKYNAKVTGDDRYFFAVGNGTSSSSRSTAFCIKNDGSVYVKGDVVHPSDARLKTNVNTLENAIDKVMKMRGVSFVWDKSVAENAPRNNDLQLGFIAQEMEKVLPELVNDGPNGYKAVNYIGVIPVLTEAIKDQQAEIDDLKKENDQLKSSLEALLKRVEALENK